MKYACHVHIIIPLKSLYLPNNDKSIRDIIWNKIKKLRESRRLLQRQMAMSLGIDVSMYSRIERGERRAKREIVVILSQILDVETEYLLCLWLADRIVSIIYGESDLADKTLQMVIETRNTTGS